MPKKKRPPENIPDTNTTFFGRDSGEVLAVLRKLKEKSLADKIELQTQIIGGDLVPRTVFASVFGQLLATYSSQINVLDLSVGDTIASILGLPAHKVRNIIGDMQYEPMRFIKKELENFIKKM